MCFLIWANQSSRVRDGLVEKRLKRSKKQLCRQWKTTPHIIYGEGATLVPSAEKSLGEPLSLNCMHAYICTDSNFFAITFTQFFRLQKSGKAAIIGPRGELQEFINRSDHPPPDAKPCDIRQNESCLKMAQTLHPTKDGTGRFVDMFGS